MKEENERYTKVWEDVFDTFICDHCKKIYRQPKFEHPDYDKYEQIIIDLELHLMKCEKYKSYLSNSRKYFSSLWQQP